MVNVFLAGKIPGGLKLGAGYSRLSGQDGRARAFDTLFSTAHKFDGWADQFVATNGGRLAPGLDELYLQMGGSWGGHDLLARYFRFDQEISGDPYGDELDLEWKTKLFGRLGTQVKAAFYSADSGNHSGVAAQDKSVLWVRLTYAF